VVKIVPKVFVSVAFVSFSELVEHWEKSVNVLFQLPIDVVLSEREEFFLEILPVFELTSHVDVLNTANPSLPGVRDILFVGVHNHDCREK
jgi:hypothetical protein